MIFGIALKALLTAIVAFAVGGCFADFYEYREGKEAAYRFWSRTWKASTAIGVIAAVAIIWTFPWGAQ